MVTISEGKLKSLEAVSNEKGVITAAAMDQRGSLQKSIAKAKGVSDRDVTPAMMSEFKTVVTRVLTPYASAILLDPEFGLPASHARSKNAGLLLAYEKTGYDATGPGRIPTFLDGYSAKRLREEGTIAEGTRFLVALPSPSALRSRWRSTKQTGWLSW